MRPKRQYSAYTRIENFQKEKIQKSNVRQNFQTLFQEIFGTIKVFGPKHFLHNTRIYVKNIVAIFRLIYHVQSNELYDDQEYLLNKGNTSEAVFKISDEKKWYLH